MPTDLRLCLVTDGKIAVSELLSGLIQSGFTCSIMTNRNGTMDNLAQEPPDLVLLDVDDYPETCRLSKEIKHKKELPIIALLNREMLNQSNGHLEVDDFIFQPYDLKELKLRINRILRGTKGTANSEQLRYGDLTIDLAKYQVTLSGRLIELTFREYELLKFLATNRGRVFTRQALLDKVWGYDYYGGDRTVDVHIRRLRSKLENSRYAFFETVRNIGYRFKKDA